MRKILLLAVVGSVVLSSCVSQKQYTELEDRYNAKSQELVDVKADLMKCLIEKEKNLNQAQSLEAQNTLLKETNNRSVQMVENLTVLTQSASENIKSVISQLSEKDKYINGIRAAMTKKDSINLALAFHLKKELQAGIQDEDIQINVEKTVVYISIADKLLFKSGSSVVSDKAKAVLGKVATVISSRPDMEVMVEGYTDTVPIKTDCISDNWDLSVKRATSVVRVLQNEYSIAPSRLVAAGRSEYLPLETNDTAEGRATNRRTRIVILPKLDQFFDILEQKPE